MEILQTIWTALTTENALLIKIINVALVIIEVIITTLLFTTILNITSTKKQRVLYISLFSLIAMLSIALISTPYNTLINLIACPILIYFIFKTKQSISVIGLFVLLCS